MEPKDEGRRTAGRKPIPVALRQNYRTNHVIDRTAQYLEDAHAAIFDDVLPAKFEEQLFRTENLRTSSSRLIKQLSEETINDQL